MPLDPLITKTLVIIVALAMYSLALFTRRLNIGLVALSFLFFAIGAPLGYDTLMYYHIISSGGLINYGPLWATLGFLANWTDAWWSVHVITYILVVYAFVALARISAWPSLLLATLTTLPGLGFDFLSVIRQGLSTAFVIFFYLALERSLATRAFLFAVLTVLAHTSGLLAIVVLLLVRFKNELSKFTLYIALALLVIFLANYLLPENLEQQVNSAAYLLTHYLTSDATIKNETGAKLFIAWIIILATPVLIAALARRISWLSMKIAAVALFLVGYGLLLAVSGASVRLVWFFLPMLMATVVATLDSRPQRLVLLPTHLCFAATCFAASAYAIWIAPEHFWAGKYPHYVPFIQ